MTEKRERCGGTPGKPNYKLPLVHHVTSEHPEGWHRPWITCAHASRACESCLGCFDCAPDKWCEHGLEVCQQQSYHCHPGVDGMWLGADGHHAIGTPCVPAKEEAKPEESLVAAIAPELLPVIEALEGNREAALARELVALRERKSKPKGHTKHFSQEAGECGCPECDPKPEAAGVMMREQVAALLEKYNANQSFRDMCRVCITALSLHDRAEAAERKLESAIKALLQSDLGPHLRKVLKEITNA